MCGRQGRAKAEPIKHWRSFRARTRLLQTLCLPMFNSCHQLIDQHLLPSIDFAHWFLRKPAGSKHDFGRWTPTAACINSTLNPSAGGLVI